jgi:hypothetical protein
MGTSVSPNDFYQTAYEVHLPTEYLSAYSISKSLKTEF